MAKEFLGVRRGFNLQRQWEIDIASPAYTTREKMATRPHLVRLAKEHIEPASVNLAEAAATLTQTVEAPSLPFQGQTAPSKPKISRKTLSILIAASILLASAGVYWALFLRPWSMHDVESHVIADPTLDTPGFSHSLAGKTVTVEGKVTGIESKATNRGDLIRVWLDHGNISLVYWDSQPYKLGDHARQGIHFEWANLNDERHVCSRQLDFPWITLLWTGMMLDSVSIVAGSVIYPEEVSERQIRINVFDWYPLVSTAGANCTLSRGESSFANDYLKSMGIWSYGNLLETVPDLSAQTMGGNISYSDADHDKNLSTGDWFDLSGIERPADAAGLYTYVFRVGQPHIDPQGYEEILAAVCYFVVGHEGLVRMIAETPYARLSLSNQTADVVKATFVKVSAPLNWSDVTIELAGNEYCRWYPNAEDLTGSSRLELPNEQLGTLSVSCTASDEFGNGLVDPGDWIAFTSQSSDAPSTNCTLSLIWEPTGSLICMSNFHW